MLAPAIAYKDELLKKFAKEIYTEKYFYYIGYGHAHDLPQIADSNSDNAYMYAILDIRKEIIGWFAYRIYTDTNSVENFGLYAFDDPDYSIVRNALTLGRDVHSKLYELVEQHHRVSWRAISGNPVINSYDGLLKEFSNKGYMVNSVRLHDITVDAKGTYHDEIIYEVINERK